MSGAQARTFLSPGRCPPSRRPFSPSQISMQLAARRFGPAAPQACRLTGRRSRRRNGPLSVEPRDWDARISSADGNSPAPLRVTAVAGLASRPHQRNKTGREERRAISFPTLPCPLQTIQRSAFPAAYFPGKLSDKLLQSFAKDTRSILDAGDIMGAITRMLYDRAGRKERKSGKGKLYQ